MPNASWARPGSRGSSSTYARCAWPSCSTIAYRPSPAGRAGGSTRTSRVLVSYAPPSTSSRSSAGSSATSATKAHSRSCRRGSASRLRATHDPAVAPVAVGLEDEEEPLDVPEVVDLVGVHPRPVEEEHVPFLDHPTHPPSVSGSRRPKTAAGHNPSSLGPARGGDAAAELVQFLFRDADAERADGGVLSRCA